MLPLTESTLVHQAHNRAVAITSDDMIHITWKHVTLHLNVTGMVYLLRLLKNTLSSEDTTRHFRIHGTPDDGYTVWIQDIGLQLSSEEMMIFKQLLSDALLALKQRKNKPTLSTLSGELLFTRRSKENDIETFSFN
ncbi:MAG: hypothetical protein AAFR81_21200 [Chloroflexota bacterium]